MWLILVCTALMLLGFLGIVIPGVPGIGLAATGALVWAIFADGSLAVRWSIFAVCALLFIVGEVVKYLWPGKRMIAAGVPSATVWLGALGGIVGFFMIPAFGLPIGFVLGVWGAETHRHGSWRAAWPSTKEALKATGLSMLVEFGFWCLIVITWVAGLLLV